MKRKVSSDKLDPVIPSLEEVEFAKSLEGQVKSTKHYEPLILVYYEAYLTKEATIKREMEIKNSGSVWMPLMKRIRESLD